MTKLRWNPMRAPLPNVQMWGAQDGLITYVISRDTGIRQDDPYYGRYFLSAKMVGSKTDDLGGYGTLVRAQKAAEACRQSA